MNATLKYATLLAGLALAWPATAEVTLYEREDYGGRSYTTDQTVGRLERFGFNDRASSVIVTGEPWEVCDDKRFGGRCVVLRQGHYPSLAAMGLDNRISSVREASRSTRSDDARYGPMPAAAFDARGRSQITLFEGEGFSGRTYRTEEPVANFATSSFNDHASSAIVLGERWEACDDSRFRGRCVVLRPGRYPSLATMGLDDRVSSVRAVSGDSHVDDNRYAPMPQSAYDTRRRDHERLYEANVTSVRAVVGTPEQRCWVEQEQVPRERGSASVPGAIAGAIIGGILGHQVGGGRGQDIATAGGAVAGAAVGANVGRSSGGTQTQDVQRCTSAPAQARPHHWDVTYSFRGEEHRIQMTSPPGSTITVNENGEPRT